MEFEWDPGKAVANKLKHGVGFVEAMEVFDDVARIDFDVSRENDGETRRKTVGMLRGKLMVVVYTPRDRVIRIISARRTNRPEEILYANRPLSL